MGSVGTRRQRLSRGGSGATRATQGGQEDPPVAKKVASEALEVEQRINAGSPDVPIVVL